MVNPVIAFFVSWITGFVFLVLVLGLGELYYPIHSWLFAGEWRWDSVERSMRFFIACIPASFIGAVGYSVKEYLDIKLKRKNENKINGVRLD